MKTRNLLAGQIVLGLALASLSRAAEPTTRFDAKSGPDMKVRIEGTSTIHDWQVEGHIIGGSIEVGPGFPTEPGQTVTPGKVQAEVKAYIPVRVLKSVEKDGSHYSDKMDEVMYDKMKSAANPRITYHSTELVLKEAPKSKDLPYVFDSKGELAVAGVTNTISMPVNVLPLGDKKLKISGSTTLKMSDFKVEAPVLIGILSTGDPVKLSFEWPVQQKQAPAADASK
ncbi:MAG TPA: YceI family protein [Candidatus Binatia bacterium]|nr:YceI family protein [Candidatus Binatia bacterium]